MTAPLVHATLRALVIIRGDRDRRTAYGLVACGGQTGDLPEEDVVFGAVDAQHYKETGRLMSWPTCPKCLVLLDAALEGRTL